MPGLDEPAAAALALISLVGRSRKEIADATDPPGIAALSDEALAEALARARKALRRSLYPLPGSGWCERAERLISDRLDDALEDPGPARLDVHLANCSRCVEHERRLAHSQDSLVAGFVQAHPAEQPEDQGAPPEPEAAPEDSTAAPPLLRAVDTPILLPAAEAEALPPPDTPADELPVLGTTEEPAQLGEAPEAAELESEAPEVAELESDAPEAAEQAIETPEPEAADEETEKPEAAPPAAVPAAWRRSSATLWSPARPSPPRTLVTADTPRPPALRPPPAPVVPAPPAPAPPAVVPKAAPTVPSTPPSTPPSDPPPSTPSSSWTSEPPRTWTPPAEIPGVWRSDAPRPQLAAHRALADESIWTNIGPLVAVLSVAVVIATLAALLAVGG